jgi:hypothetical protein
MATTKTAGADTKHPNLVAAVLAVMKEVKGMEKNSKVGAGQAQYDGTKDQDVKEVFNEVMARHGLICLPIEIEERAILDRWEEKAVYSGQEVIKNKQSVFTVVKTKYKLMHESGEFEILAGYGHGVDTQDKGAGKATTYALKNTLLYSFLTPVGKIDDTDTKHSNEIVTPPVAAPAPVAPVETEAQKKKAAAITRAVELIISSTTEEELKANAEKVVKFKDEKAIKSAKVSTMKKLGIEIKKPAAATEKPAA